MCVSVRPSHFSPFLTVSPLDPDAGFNMTCSPFPIPGYKVALNMFLKSGGVVFGGAPIPACRVQGFSILDSVVDNLILDIFFIVGCVVSLVSVNLVLLSFSFSLTGISLSVSNYSESY